jgi:DNA polymerase III epsilon subunit family exonuclease
VSGLSGASRLDGDRSLVRAVARRLGGGPAHTFELAEDVLGLTGNRGAVAAAVFQLLSADRRFLVDEHGVWRLDPDAVPLGRSLSELRFAVVDVETTGGASWRGHRIIDIGIVEVTGGRITAEYESLVNPGRAVPPMITSLTGITTDMVRDAPYFEHVADEIAGLLRGRVFVAHNAMFDWGFVSRELTDALGDAPDVPRLCTVRLARRLVPELKRRNLDVVCRHFGVPIHARHRAHGDALATARVLLRLLDEAAGLGIDDLETLDEYLRRRARRRFDPNQFSLEGL